MGKNRQEILNKINKEWTEVPVFTEEQILEQQKLSIRFLERVAPSKKGGAEGAIELRPLRRNKKDKTFIRSKHFWDFKEKDEEYLNNYLTQLNGHAFCSYYSTWSFDYAMQVEKERKTVVNNLTLEDEVKITYRKKGMVNNENALYTQILPLDLDGINYDDYLQYKRLFVDIGIQTLDVWTGHGAQILILLKEKLYNKKIYQHWVDLLVSKGIPIDTKIVDPARVLRMPYGFNCKALDTYINKNDVETLKFPELNKKIRNVFLLTETDERYNYIDIFKKVRSLPDVINKQEIDFLEEEEQQARQSTLLQTVSKNTKPQKVALDSNRTAVELTVEALNTLQNDYYMLNVRELPLAIQNMLQGAPQGLRARSVLFLAPFLQNYYKMDKQIIKKVVQIFESKCTPATRHFTHEDLGRFLSHKPKYTQDLCNKFGYIDFKKIIVVNKDKMKVSKQFFYYYNELSDGAVSLYLKMKLYQEDTKQLCFTAQEIEIKLGIKKRTFFKYVSELISLQFLFKKTTVKTKEETFAYSLNLFKQNSYITLSKSMLELLFAKANTGEVKLYTYFKFIVHGENEETCTMSQTLLGTRTNKAQNSITRLTNSLQEKGFINKITMGTGIQINSVYKLLR